MNQELIREVEEFLKTPKDLDLNLKGIPATDDQISEAEEILNVKFHDEFIAFIKKFGGTSIGVDVYAFQNNELISKDTIIDLTLSFREDYKGDERSKIIEKSYVFSFDSMGNPIMINEKGKVIIFYHDSDESEILTHSFSKFVEALIKGNSIYEI